MVLKMSSNEKLECELITLYESILCDLNNSVKNKIVVLKEITNLYDAIERVEERLDELTFKEDDV